MCSVSLFVLEAFLIIDYSLAAEAIAFLEERYIYFQIFHSWCNVCVFCSLS